MSRPDPEVWASVLEALRNMYPALCRHWFDDIEPMSMEGGTLKLLVREQVQLKYLRRCCTTQFTEALQHVTGALVTVQFVGEDEAATEQESGAPKRVSGKLPGSAEFNASTAGEMFLSPDYTFDTFVVGPDNELAHAAAVAVAGKPGQAYNPLFIHGGVGLGKTHLLQAACQAAMRNHRGLNLHYTSCNDFMTAFHESVQNGQMAEFRHRFRNVDLLVIDDIHDLAKRDRTQEEFFHTFNSLYLAGRQIVLSSDTPPAEIPDLEERLISRFNCGLVARIERPCYESRVRIVQIKARLRNIKIPDDVVAYVAAKIDTNIRELEGAIVKISGFAEIANRPVTLELAKQAIGDQVAGSGSQHPTIQNIIDAITVYYDVKLTDLLSKKRHKSIALPRQVGMWLARKHTRYSLEEIGGYFGGRDHTTVMHAVKTIEQRRSDNNTLDHDVSRLEDQLLNQRQRPTAGV